MLVLGHCSALFRIIKGSMTSFKSIERSIRSISKTNAILSASLAGGPFTGEKHGPLKLRPEL
jgi:hypothetical protein